MLVFNIYKRVQFQLSLLISWNHLPLLILTGVSSDIEDEDDPYRKRKKSRTAFSREQVADLEKKFQDKKYLSSNERGELADKLKLSDMQVKTWFQNRRMKFKRQSEEAEMEMKASKYSFNSIMPYGNVNMTSFYGYMPNGMPYPYPSNIRSPQTPSASSLDGYFSHMDMSSPTMLSGFSSPLSTTPHRHGGGISPLIRSAPPNTSYFTSNGLLTPVSPSTSSYQHTYCNSDSTTHSALSSYTQMPFVAQDWQRTLPTPPVTTPWITLNYNLGGRVDGNRLQSLISNVNQLVNIIVLWKRAWGNAHS